MTLAKELNLDVKHAIRKQKIKNILIDRLVADDLLDEEYLENKVEILDSWDATVKLKQLKIQEMIELAKLQMQEQERQERLKIEEKERKEKPEIEKVFKQQELDTKIQMEQKQREDRLAIINNGKIN